MSEEKKPSIIFRLFKLLIWIWLIWWIIVYNKFSNFENIVLTDKTKSVTIQKWETFRSLDSKFLWEDWNKLIDKTYLKAYLKINPPSYELQAWEYKIAKDTKISNLYSQLEKPIEAKEENITFLEWWNIFDMDEYLTNKEMIEEWAFIKYARVWFEWLRVKYPFLEKALTLEWFLYPDTYTVNMNKFNPEYLSIKMLDNFETKIYEPLLMKESKEEIVNIINLASIVEKEERNKEERPNVAAILKKRLNNDWMIGADITVCYPHDLTSEECKLVVTEYIAEVNDYNTRTKKGLPKTPIGNPHSSAVDAVVNSPETKYWFYLHNTSTGKIYYAITNAEHEYNKANYMR